MHVGGWKYFGGFAIIIGLIIFFLKGISIGGEYDPGIPLLVPAKYVVGAIFIING